MCTPEVMRKYYCRTIFWDKRRKVSMKHLLQREKPLAKEYYLSETMDDSLYYGIYESWANVWTTLNGMNILSTADPQLSSTQKICDMFYGESAMYRTWFMYPLCVYLDESQWKKIQHQSIIFQKLLKWSDDMNPCFNKIHLYNHEEMITQMRQRMNQRISNNWTTLIPYIEESNGQDLDKRRYVVIYGTYLFKNALIFGILSLCPELIKELSMNAVQALTSFRVYHSGLNEKMQYLKFPIVPIITLFDEEIIVNQTIKITGKSRNDLQLFRHTSLKLHDNTITEMETIHCNYGQFTILHEELDENYIVWMKLRVYQHLKHLKMSTSVILIIISKFHISQIQRLLPVYFGRETIKGAMNEISEQFVMMDLDDQTILEQEMKRQQQRRQKYFTDIFGITIKPRVEHWSWGDLHQRIVLELKEALDYTHPKYRKVFATYIDI